MRKSIKNLLPTLFLSIALIISNSSIVKADATTNLPNTIAPTQAEMTQLQNMTLDQLKSTAKPMPESALDKNHVLARLNLLPEDGNIYHYENSEVDGSKDDIFFKFLYISPDTLEPGCIKYYTYKWAYVNNKTYSVGIKMGEIGNDALYNQLTGRSPFSSISANVNQTQTTSPSTTDNTNSNTTSNTTPPTQTEVIQLQNMTLDQLKATAKPMPEAACENNQGIIRLGDWSYVPQDRQIYYIESKSSKFDEIVYYKFLYLTPIVNDVSNNIQITVYKWDFVNGVLQSDYSGEASGTSSNTDSNNGNSNNSSNTKKYTQERIYGENRIATAAKIAKTIYSGTIQNVVLATGENFPDALSGSVLAKKLDAPILLVNPSDNKVILDYISKHLDKSGTIYILGGDGAVDDDVVNKLGYKVVRLNGNNRYETNININKAISVNEGTPLIIATGENFPDALSISSVAAMNGYPIVLSNKDNIPEGEETYINSIKPTKIFIVGGIGVISDNVKNRIKTITGIDDSNIIRISGSNRYETSLSIAKYFNLGSKSITMATGENFPDALTGSILAAKKSAPILLINEDATEQKTFIDGKSINDIYILGGEAVISQAIENALLK